MRGTRKRGGASVFTHTRAHAWATWVWCVQIMHVVRHKMHIQMDNPCMFLPQEKVSDFSLKNKKEVCVRMHAACVRGMLVCV